MNGDIVEVLLGQVRQLISKKYDCLASFERQPSCRPSCPCEVGLAHTCTAAEIGEDGVRNQRLLFILLGAYMER